jgi:uncharacterized membrane protein
MKEIKMNVYLLLVHFVLLSALYPLLPNDVAMQYGSSGQVNYTLPKLLATLLIFAIHVLVLIVFNQQKKSVKYTAFVQVLLISISFIMLFIQR